MGWQQPCGAQQCEKQSPAAQEEQAHAVQAVKQTLEPGSVPQTQQQGKRQYTKKWNTGGSLWSLGNIYLLWRWLSTGTGCQERLWKLPPLTYSKAVWTLWWANDSNWLCLSGVVGQDDPKRCLPNSTILWFCDFSLSIQVKQDKKRSKIKPCQQAALQKTMWHTVVPDKQIHHPTWRENI